MVENSLVSVAVVTYNSALTVIETLDSILNQTYENLELIISDDCSTDNTIDICKKWLQANRSRFVRAEIINTNVNTGIAANLNRAINNSKGVWVKSIAGDDILYHNCIEENVKYIQSHEDTLIVFSPVQEFSVNKEGKPIYGEITPMSSEMIDFAKLSAHDQYISCLKNTAPLPAPSVFIRRDLLVQYPFNENYRMSEDVPMWITLTRNGIHIDCIDKILVYYRRGGTITSTTNLFSPLFWNSKRAHFWNEYAGMLLSEGLDEEYKKNRLRLLMLDFMDCFTDLQNNLKNRIIFKIVNVLLYKVFKFRYK